MSGRFGFIRHRVIAASLLVAGALIAAWSLYPRAASAQGGDSMPMSMRDRIYSTGPFTLHNREHVRIGLVLPVVMESQAEMPMPAQFVLRNSAGQSFFFDLKPPNPSNPSRSDLADSFFDVFFDSFFDITYYAMNKRCMAATNTDGCFEIHSKGTPGGGDQPMPTFVPSGDGILTGLLLPAMGPNGMIASPIATSMQSFNPMGGTMTHSFFDVFFDVF